MSGSLVALTWAVVLAAVGANSTTAQGDASPAVRASTGLSLVGLGDSYPGAQGCLTDCQSFVQTYGDLASEALGVPVSVQNLATNDSLESGGLLRRVTSDAAHREALAEADLITVMIGWNDWQGPCVWDGLAECLTRGSATVERNLTLILDEIALLREGQPTVLRVVSYFDPYVGWAELPELGGFEPAETDAFDAAFSQALGTFNAMLCRLAQEHEGVCVDTRTPMNGPDRASEAQAEPAEGAVLHVDHVHLSAAGHDLVAQAIADTGFAPLG